MARVDKEALKEYHREYRKRNPDKTRKYSERHRHANPGSHLLYSARRRAAESGLTFSLTKEDVPVPELCPILKEPLVIGTDYAPSLDRIDNSKGYDPDNVQVISLRANRLKSSASIKELKLFAEWIKTLE